MKNRAEHSVGCEWEISFKKDIIATGNVFCKQNCQQASVICTSYVQHALFLLIKYTVGAA